LVVRQEAPLEREETIRKFRFVLQEVKRQVQSEAQHYSLDAIVSVAYRLKSHCGEQFRKWDIQVLKIIWYKIIL